MATTLQQALNIIYNNGRRVHDRNWIDDNNLKFPKRFSIKKVSSELTTIPLNLIFTSSSTITPYFIIYKYCREVSTISTAVIKAFSHIMSIRNLGKIKVKNIGILYIGKGIILDEKFNLIMFSEDVYTYKNNTTEPEELNHRIVKFNSRIYKDFNNEIGKFISTKLIPEIMKLDTAIPIKIEISDIDNILFKPELYNVSNVSDDINEYIANNFQFNC